MPETPREIRENLILQRYEKKLNRDELLKVLDWNEIINSEKKNEIKSEILENFYKNYEKAKENNEFQAADELYRKQKTTKKQIEKKEAEMIEMKKSNENKIQDLDDQMLEIAEVALSLEDWSLFKKLKLKRANERRDELQSQQRRINWDIYKLHMDKEKLTAVLKKDEETYWPKTDRPKIKWKRIANIVKAHEELEKQHTLKWYKEKYFQIIKEKEEYLQKFMSEIDSIDLWLSEDKKKEIIDKMKKTMENEIETMKWWDDITKLADETEKRFEGNREIYTKKLKELEREIKEKEDEIKEIEEWEWTSVDDVLQSREDEFIKRKELLDLQDKYKALKTELEEKLKKYDGTVIDWTDQIHVETRDEKLDRKKKRIEKLKGDTNAILKDLKENHVKIEKNAEVEWYKWKEVHFSLPAVWNFEWFKFDYFVSNDLIDKKDFEAKSELKKKLYSMNDVSKLLQAMNEYMTELWGENDGNIDYEAELKYWETEKYRCAAWDCLKAITWLDYVYWLSDKDVEWRMNSRVGWDCDDDDCYFSRISYDYYSANLFLRLSD